MSCPFDQSLQRLRLTSLDTHGPSPQPSRLALGTCPRTQGEVRLNQPADHLIEIIYKWGADLPLADATTTKQDPPHAKSQCLWLINTDEHLRRSWHARFARLGWRVEHVDNCANALSKLSSQSHGPQPSLLLALTEHPDHLEDVQALVRSWQALSNSMCSWWMTAPSLVSESLPCCSPWGIGLGRRRQTSPGGIPANASGRGIDEHRDA